MNAKTAKVIAGGCLCAYLFVVCPIHGQPSIDDPSSVGFIMQPGTANASGVGVTMSTGIEWAPPPLDGGLSPSEHIELHQGAKLMENEEEVKNV